MREMRCRHLDAWEWSLDALNHAPGLVVCRIRLSGFIEKEGYPRYYIVHRGGMITTRRGGLRHLPRTYEGVGRKERLYANEFHALWMGNATLVVHRFACDLADLSLQTERAMGGEPDKRVWTMVETRRAWLAGLLSEGELQAEWMAFEAAEREHNKWRPPVPRGRPMTASESYEHKIWNLHAFSLSAVRYATEPVPLAAGRSVQNVKAAIGVAANARTARHSETQEEWIVKQRAAVEAINVELGRRLTDTFAPEVVSDHA